MLSSGSLLNNNNNHQLLEMELMDAGTKLLQSSSRTDDIIRILLQKLNKLCKVEQEPSESMKFALRQVIKALDAKEIMRHPDLDVNISHSCCFCEILRICAPDYLNLLTIMNHQQLKAFFEMVVAAFEKLSSASGKCYKKMAKVLEIFSRHRVFILMFDPELDGAGLIFRLFKQFSTVADSNPAAIVPEMENIMRTLMEESVELNLELVDRLVIFLKDTNKIASNDCCEQGKVVLSKFAARFKLHFPETGNIKTERQETATHCQQFLNYPPKSVTEEKRKRKRDHGPSEKQVASSVDDYKVCVHGYEVKQSIAHILEAVFKKYGDIAANCTFKTTSMRAPILEVLCDVVKRIQTNSVLEKMEETERQVADAEAVNIEVAWLRVHLEAIREKTEANLERIDLVRKTTKGILLNERGAHRDLNEAEAEVVAAREGVELAEMFANRLRMLEKNWDEKILECKAIVDSLAQQPFPDHKIMVSFRVMIA